MAVSPFIDSVWTPMMDAVLRDLITVELGNPRTQQKDSNDYACRRDIRPGRWYTFLKHYNKFLGVDGRLVDAVTDAIGFADYKSCYRSVGVGQASVGIRAVFVEDPRYSLWASFVATNGRKYQRYTLKHVDFYRSNDITEVDCHWYKRQTDWPSLILFNDKDELTQFFERVVRATKTDHHVVNNSFVQMTNAHILTMYRISMYDAKNGELTSNDYQQGVEVLGEVEQLYPPPDPVDHSTYRTQRDIRVAERVENE